MAYCTIQTPSGELYHHGILGQKWGQRQGPPYPLNASDHSASEKKAGWKASLGATTRKLAESNMNRMISKQNAKKAYKSGKIDKAAYKQKMKDADAKNWQEHKEALGLNKSRAQRAAEATQRDADSLRKAGYKKEADAVQKVADKNKAKAEKQSAKAEFKQKLKDVDPSVAKNKQTKRVAMDYHTLSDREFRVKYKGSKKTFAKRYEKSKGDTYSRGLRKATIAAGIMAMSKDVKYYDLRSGKVKTVKMGKEAAIRTLAADIGYSEAATRLGYKKAEQAYNDKKEFEEWKKNRDN